MCLMYFDNENQRDLGCKFYFDESYMIVYICLTMFKKINCKENNFSLQRLLHLRRIQNDIVFFNT